MYHRLPRLAAAIAIGGALLGSATGVLAHVTGTSYGDFALVDATNVESTLTFARADAALLAPGGEPDVRALVAQGIDVRADGAECPGVLERAGEVGGDGVEVRARFGCPHPPGTLDVSLPLLDTLPAGHLHQVRITASGRSIDAVLRSSSQHAQLKTGAEPPLVRVVVGTSAAAVGLLVVGLAWWWKARRERER
jgi:hypothetical protein